MFTALGAYASPVGGNDTWQCTLTEHVGQRVWPHDFTVLLRADVQPWVFTGEQSLRWLIDYPRPLFLGILDEENSRLRLYQTLPRFGRRVPGRFPDPLVLVPDYHVEGECRWNAGNRVDLGAPVIDFTLPETHRRRFVAHIQLVLQEWLSWEQENLRRMANGTKYFVMPGCYRTNSNQFPRHEDEEGKGAGGVRCRPPVASKEDLDAAIRLLKPGLDWVTYQLEAHGKLTEAVRGMLLLRSLFKCDANQPVSFHPEAMDKLRSVIGPCPEHLCGPVDMLDRHLDLGVPDGIYRSSDPIEEFVRDGYAFGPDRVQEETSEAAEPLDSAVVEQGAGVEQEAGV